MSTTFLKPIVYGWAAFAGTHLAMSHPNNREKLIKLCGSEDAFKGLYSIVALATFTPTTYFYYKYGRHAGPLLWAVTPTLITIGDTLTALSAFVFSQALSTPGLGSKVIHQNSIEINQESDPFEPQGILRITRHPLFGSFAILGLGNALKRGMLGSVIYWGMFPVFWYIGSIHQDYRHEKAFVQYSDYFENTSVIPFAAVLKGKQSMRDIIKETDWNQALIFTSGAVSVILGKRYFFG